uniref:Uncharacterized protein n=1 Tax=Physcomitrium patens TaxID=3218 RepID=A0A7I3ZZ54_PHYPA
MTQLGCRHPQLQRQGDHWAGDFLVSSRRDSRSSKKRRAEGAAGNVCFRFHHWREINVDG